MGRALLFAGLITVLAPASNAQDTPRAELFGGYSYFRAEGGNSLHGWNASIAANVNDWFGVVADFGGHYGNESLRVTVPDDIFIDAESSNNVHTFLFGPRFSYRKHRTLTPFAHALVGASRSHVEATVDTPIFSTRISDTDTDFAAAFGGGLDARISDRFAFRVFQADYLPTGRNENFRLSTGVVIRFGQ